METAKWQRHEPCDDSHGSGSQGYGSQGSGSQGRPDWLTATPPGQWLEEGVISATKTET